MLRKTPHPPQPRLTADEIEVRIWAFVVGMVMLVFAGITASMLYSVMFVVQPIKSMAPIDTAFTKMLNDIVLLIVGGIGGIMSKRAVGAAAKAIAGPTPPQPYAGQCPAYPTQPAPYTPQPASGGMPDFNWMGWNNPELDETWTPGPPPTTPPEHLEPDHEREELAHVRANAKVEA